MIDFKFGAYDNGGKSQPADDKPSPEMGVVSFGPHLLKSDLWPHVPCLIDLPLRTTRR